MFRKYIGPLLVLALLFSCAACLFACSEDGRPIPWGRTLTFADYSEIDDLVYTVDGKALPLKTICTDYFDKINWQETVGVSREAVGSGENGLRLIREKLHAQMNEKALRALSFAFSGEADGSVTIDGTSYTVTVTGDGAYRVLLAVTSDENGSREEYFTLRPYGENSFVYDYLPQNANEKLPQAQSTVSMTFTGGVLVGTGEYATTNGANSIPCFALFR